MYKGEAATILKGLDVGERILVKGVKRDFEGQLMPRPELADDRHIVLKLDSGYNMGISLEKIKGISLVEKGRKIKTKPPSHEEDPDLPSVTIIGTGGTIASKIDYKTGAVAPAFTAGEVNAAVPELSKIANIRTRMLFNILSENMGPYHWKEIALATADELNKGASGVVIAHGTDTLGYTSSALSFILKDLGAPVVVVGSQRSSDRPSSDSAMNLIAAVRLCTAHIRGVYAVMHGSMSDDHCLIHKGTRVRKMHSSRRDAFRSINTPAVGKVTSKIEAYEELPKRTDQTVTLDGDFQDQVALIKINPGLKPETLDHYAESYKGIVIEGTGLGHLPERLFPSLERAAKKGIPMVMTSQTLYGRIDMKVYSTGRHLLELGVIEGADMLPETALVKLMWVLGKTQDKDEIKRLMEADIAGELSQMSRPDTFLR